MRVRRRPRGSGVASAVRHAPARPCRAGTRGRLAPDEAAHPVRHGSRDHATRLRGRVARARQRLPLTAQHRRGSRNPWFRGPRPWRRNVVPARAGMTWAPPLPRPAQPGAHGRHVSHLQHEHHLDPIAGRSPDGTSKDAVVALFAAADPAGLIGWDGPGPEPVFPRQAGTGAMAPSSLVVPSNSAAPQHEWWIIVLLHHTWWGLTGLPSSKDQASRLRTCRWCVGSRGSESGYRGQFR